MASPDAPALHRRPAQAARSWTRAARPGRLLRDDFHRVGKVDGIVHLRAQLSELPRSGGPPTRAPLERLDLDPLGRGVIVRRPPAPARRSSGRPRRRSSSRRTRRPRAPRRSRRPHSRAWPQRRAPPAVVAGHRRPRAAVGDLDGDAVVGAAGAEQRRRVLEVAGDAGADVQRGPRPARARCSSRRRAATVVTTDVISGRPSARPSMRSVSRASALTALRPRAVSAPACAGTPVSSIVRHSAPLRAETRSPFSRAHSKTSAAVASAARAAQAGSRSRTSSSAQTISRSSRKGRRSRERLHRHRRQHQAALHVGDAGAVAAHPSRRNGRSATVPSGKTVSPCPSSATTPSPSPGSEMQTLRAG